MLLNLRHFLKGMRKSAFPGFQEGFCPRRPPIRKPSLPLRKCTARGPATRIGGCRTTTNRTRPMADAARRRLRCGRWSGHWSVGVFRSLQASRNPILSAPEGRLALYESRTPTHPVRNLFRSDYSGKPPQAAARQVKRERLGPWTGASFIFEAETQRIGAWVGSRRLSLVVSEASSMDAASSAVPPNLAVCLSLSLRARCLC